ncbi:hypothetical protein BpHYR1_043712, partial [Brachionus plicatilis]
MAAEPLQENIPLPANVEIFSFIGSRSSPEIRYLCTFVSSGEQQKSKNSAIICLKWSSFINNNILTFLANLNSQPEPTDYDLDIGKINETIKSGKRVRILIGFNLNDYNDFSIEEMIPLEKILKNSIKIFFFCYNEEKYFDFCMTERISSDMFYETIWPNFVSFTKILLAFASQFSLESNLVLISTLDSLKTSIKHLEQANLLQNFSSHVTQRKLLAMIDTIPFRKSGQYIKDLIKDTKSKFRSEIKKKEDEFYRFHSRNNASSVLQYLIDFFESRSKYSFEEKSVFKNVFVNGSENSVRPCLLSALLDSMATLLNQKIDLDLIEEAISILRNLSHHLIFKHGVFNNKEFLPLIYHLLESDSNILKYEATDLIKQMLITDYKRYGNLLVDFDTKYCSSIILLLYDLVVEFLLKYTNDCVDKTTQGLENKILYDTIRIESLELCLKVVEKNNCDNFCPDKIENLFTLCVKNRFLPFKRIKTKLYAILNVLLKYGPSSFWMSRKRLNLILNDLNGTLQFLIENNFTKSEHWQRSSQFLIDILIFIRKNPQYDSGEVSLLDNNEMGKIKDLIMSFNGKNVNQLDYESLSIINDYNQEFFIECLTEMCLKDSFNSPGHYAKFFYRVQNFYSKKLLISILKNLFTLYAPSPVKIIKLLRLVGELICMDVIDNELIEPVVNEWFEKGLHKLAISLSLMTEEKLEKKLFEKFTGNESDKIYHLASKHENLEDFLAETFGLASQNLTKKFHQNFTRLQSDFKIEYEKAAELSGQEVLEIKIQNENLIKMNKNFQSEILNLKNELKRIDADRQEKLNEISELRAIIEKFKNSKKNTPFEFRAAKEETTSFVLDESNIDLDQIEDDQTFEQIDLSLDSEKCKQILGTLKHKRKTFKEFRSLIRGSLKHLSINLYTSPFQFLSEIIQNFEDTEYDSANKPWFIKLIIDKDYLIFCNNEKGFKAKDVKSICSCSESSKQKGKHIGHKGLGFKSVFLCSDNPVIVSKQWQFEFRKEKDEISFITPHYVEKIPDTLANCMSLDSLSTTFIYLPLREELKYNYGDEKNENYFSDIRKNIDPNILLFTNKIKKMIIENKIKQSETVIECFESGNLAQNFGYEHSEKILRIDNTENRVKIFRKKIQIPDNLVGLEELQSDLSEITIGFPESKKCAKIFAFLPVCDLNFNFIINADWILVTNRESINLNSKLNVFYRDKIAEFFVQIVSNETSLKKNILEYIPKNFDLLSDFWKQFVNDLKYGLRSLICEKLNFDKNIKTYVFNEDLRFLLGEKFVNYYGIKLIYPNETGIDYEYYGFSRITLDTILDHLSNCECQELDDEWWINFYRLINLNFDDSIKDKCFKANIFLIENQRKSLNEKSKFYLIRDDLKQLNSWRDNLTLIDYRSLAERNFLCQKLKIAKITKDYIKNFIKNLHLENKELGSLNLIWQDLDFIKQNYADEKMILFVPTSCGKLRPIHKCFLSRLANYDLSCLTSCFDLIDFREESLEWELFFIKQQCRFPQLDMEENKIDQLFNGFSLYTSNDLIYLDQILDLIEGYKIKDFLLRLPVKTRYMSDENFVTLLAKTCASSVYDGCLPSIDISVSMFQIAQRMGVTTTLNFTNCTKVLSNLIENEINDPNLYINWFLNLKSHHDTESISDLELIILENGHKYKISDLYCCDSTPGVELICKYLKKGLINFEKNSAFKPIESILISFGANVKACLADCLKCLNKMVNDCNLFNNKSMINRLTSHGFQDFYQIFFTIEMILRNEDELKADAIDSNCIDMDKRESIVALVQTKKSHLEAKYGPLSIPIVTYDNHVYSRSEIGLNTLSVCFQSDFLKICIQKLPDFIFLNQLIFKQCPYLFGLINGEYLTKHIVLHLQHTNSNIEETNYFITQVFHQASGIPNVQVAKANYMPIRIQLKKYEHESSIAYNSIKFAIFKKEWVYIACNEYTGANLASILGSALKTLLRSLDPNKSETSLVSESKEYISRISKSSLNRSNWKAWDHSCSPSTQFNLNEIVFADDDFDSSKFSEVVFTSNSNVENFMKFVKNDFLSDHECYMRKLNLVPEKVRINDKITSQIVAKQIFNSENIEVNYEKQKACSIKAEHFICCYLKKEYGNEFNEYENWVSSARNFVYPSNLYSYNDSLGYDFSILDHKNLFSFSYGSNTESNLCFVEVKGTEREWDGNFHLSINEINKKEEIRMLNESRRNNQRYVIVVVEWTSNPEKTRIAMRIDWTNNDSIINISPESYLARYVPKNLEINFEKNNLRHTSNNTSSQSRNFNPNYKPRQKNRASYYETNRPILKENEDTRYKQHKN